MNRSEFIHKILHVLGNDIYFDLFDKQYNVGYDPVALGNGEFGFDEIGIYQMPYVDEENVRYFKTIDEMVDNYIIDGKPLGEHLDNIQNLHCTVYA